MFKYFELKKEDLIIGLSNAYHDLPILKKHVQLGYKITKVTVLTNSIDEHGRVICNNIILKN